MANERELIQDTLIKSSYGDKKYEIIKKYDNKYNKVDKVLSISLAIGLFGFLGSLFIGQQYISKQDENFRKKHIQTETYFQATQSLKTLESEVSKSPLNLSYQDDMIKNLINQYNDSQNNRILLLEGAISDLKEDIGEMEKTQVIGEYKEHNNKITSGMNYITGSSSLLALASLFSYGVYLPISSIRKRREIKVIDRQEKFELELLAIDKQQKAELEHLK